MNGSDADLKKVLLDAQETLLASIVAVQAPIKKLRGFPWDFLRKIPLFGSMFMMILDAMFGRVESKEKEFALVSNKRIYFHGTYSSGQGALRVASTGTLAIPLKKIHGININEASSSVNHKVVGLILLIIGGIWALVTLKGIFEQFEFSKLISLAVSAFVTWMGWKMFSAKPKITLFKALSVESPDNNIYISSEEYDYEQIALFVKELAGAMDNQDA